MILFTIIVSRLSSNNFWDLLIDLVVIFVTIKQDLVMIFSIFMRKWVRHEYLRKSWICASKKRPCEKSMALGKLGCSTDRYDRNSARKETLLRHNEQSVCWKKLWQKSFREACCRVWPSEQAFNREQSCLAVLSVSPLCRYVSGKPAPSWVV